MAAAWASVDKLKELDLEVLMPGHGKSINASAVAQVRALNRITN
ncbi:MAG TPA: hypothetical protein VKK79_11045 [Candidatus Lokiarchaeia archaeon]|nr:hypothetical protein [Candidatus Lokiarchaeia archaeon]